jgi:hypothetical protein
MDWITIIKNGETRRVRPHGLAHKQSMGWVVLGADQGPEEPKTSPESPKVVDSGPVVARPPKGRSK